MAKNRKTTRAGRLAEQLVDLLGEGPEEDPERYEQAKIALTAWCSAQDALFGALREFLMMRDEPERYLHHRFERWS